MNVKTLLRQMLPAVIGLGAGYPLARLLVRVDLPLRFALATLAVMAFWYLLVRLNYFNHRRDVEERAQVAGLLGKKGTLGGAVPHWPLSGYLPMLMSALMIGYGFAYGWQLPWSVLAGGAIWWWGDSRLTLINTEFLRERLESKTPAKGAAPAAGTARKPREETPPPQATPPEPRMDEAAARQAALMRAIDERKKEDPLVGAKMGARELNQRLLNAMKSERGVHTESLLSTLGALAGYACQVSLRSEALSRGESANSPFTVVQGNNGHRYFFGDPLNQRLAEGHYSVWNIATSTLRKEGLQTVPDLTPIFQHVAASVGSAQFGIPRFPDGHNASDLPLNYVKDLWPVVLPVVRQFSPKPAEWPILFGFALQEVLRMSKDVLAPEVALLVVMESAIPMSKVDLQTA